jgi:hypothetical protein
MLDSSSLELAPQRITTIYFTDLTNTLVAYGMMGQAAEWYS